MGSSLEYFQPSRGVNKLTACCVIEIAHILREGNKLADHLVNLTLEQHTIVQANLFVELNTQCRRILNSDKLRLPYIRVINAKPTTQI